MKEMTSTIIPAAPGFYLGIPVCKGTLSKDQDNITVERVFWEPIIAWQITPASATNIYAHQMAEVMPVTIDNPGPVAIATGLIKYPDGHMHVMDGGSVFEEAEILEEFRRTMAAQKLAREKYGD